MSSTEGELSRLLEDPAARARARRGGTLSPTSGAPRAPAVRTPILPPARVPLRPALPPTGIAALPPRTPRLPSPPSRPAPPTRPRLPAPPPARKVPPALPPVARTPVPPPADTAPEEVPALAEPEEALAPLLEEQEELGPSAPRTNVGRLMLAGGPRARDEGGRTNRFHCPACGMMADLGRLDDAPYAVDLWVQTYGGKAGVNIHTDGTNNPTPRGSISYYQAGTPEEAERIADRLAEVAREILRRHESGTLVQF
jgi:hypothetical protein